MSNGQQAHGGGRATGPFRLRRAWFALIVAVLVAVAGFVAWREAQPVVHRIDGYTMGSTWSVSFVGPRDADAAAVRAALEAEARALGLAWVDDPSNASLDLDRNFLRQDILPRISARWPACRDTLARGAHWLRGQVVVERLALAQLLQGRSGRDRYGDYLQLDGLAAWEQPLRQALLRQWLQALHLPMPSAARLQALDRDVLLAREDATGLWTLEAAGQPRAISRYRQRLYAHRPVPAAPAVTIDWVDPRQDLPLGHGRLCADAASGPGSLAVAFPLRVTFRQGGERCRPAGRAHSQTLKRLLQAHGLPPWLRDSVPLLHAGETLVAVGDCWVCAGYEAAPGQSGWKIRWEIPPPSLS